MERPGEPPAAERARLADLTAGAVALAAVAGLALADGGYFPSAWGWATVGLAWAALAALLLRRRVELGRAELGALALLAAFTCWTLLSAVWAVDAALALDEATRLLVYVAGLGTLLVVAARGSPPWIAGGVLLATAAVGALNLLRDRLTTIDPNEQGAFSWPVGYDNGLALLLALGIVLAAGLARRTRGASLAALPLLAVPLASTDSRAGLLALLAGLAALVAARRRAALAAVLALALAAAFALGWRESPERRAYWRVAGEVAADNPALGAGAGAFTRLWPEERELPLQARDAHSLYLETLAETGPLGLALLGGALLLPLAGAARLPAATGGYLVFLVHAAVDWDWELPAVTLAGLGCGAALLVALRPEHARPVPRAAGAAAAVALAAAGLLGLVRHADLDEAALGDAGERVVALAVRANEHWTAGPAGVRRSSRGLHRVRANPSKGLPAGRTSPQLSTATATAGRFATLRP